MFNYEILNKLIGNLNIFSCVFFFFLMKSLDYNELSVRLWILKIQQKCFGLGLRPKSWGSPPIYRTQHKSSKGPIASSSTQQSRKPSKRAMLKWLTYIHCQSWFFIHFLIVINSENVESTPLLIPMALRRQGRSTLPQGGALTHS
jgi:hypothetical protein